MMTMPCKWGHGVLHYPTSFLHSIQNVYGHLIFHLIILILTEENTQG